MGDMIAYLRDKPKTKQLAWMIMEEMHEQNPYQEFGWDGFMIFIFYRINC